MDAHVKLAAQRAATSRDGTHGGTRRDGPLEDFMVKHAGVRQHPYVPYNSLWRVPGEGGTFNVRVLRSYTLEDGGMSGTPVPKAKGVNEFCVAVARVVGDERKSAVTVMVFLFQLTFPQTQTCTQGQDKIKCYHYNVKTGVIGKSFHVSRLSWEESRPEARLRFKKDCQEFLGIDVVEDPSVDPRSLVKQFAKPIPHNEGDAVTELLLRWALHPMDVITSVTYPGDDNGRESTLTKKHSSRYPRLEHGQPPHASLRVADARDAQEFPDHAGSRGTSTEWETTIKKFKDMHVRMSEQVAVGGARNMSNIAKLSNKHKGFTGHCAAASLGQAVAVGLPRLAQALSLAHDPGKHDLATALTGLVRTVRDMHASRGQTSSDQAGAAATSVLLRTGHDSDSAEDLNRVVEHATKIFQSSENLLLHDQLLLKYFKVLKCRTTGCADTALFSFDIEASFALYYDSVFKDSGKNTMSSILRATRGLIDEGHVEQKSVAKFSSGFLMGACGAHEVERQIRFTSLPDTVIVSANWDEDKNVDKNAATKFVTGADLRDGSHLHLKDSGPGAKASSHVPYRLKAVIHRAVTLVPETDDKVTANLTKHFTATVLVDNARGDNRAPFSIAHFNDQTKSRARVVETPETADSKEFLQYAHGPSSALLTKEGWNLDNTISQTHKAHMPATLLYERIHSRLAEQQLTRCKPVLDALCSVTHRSYMAVHEDEGPLCIRKFGEEPNSVFVNAQRLRTALDNANPSAYNMGIPDLSTRIGQLRSAAHELADEKETRVLWAVGSRDSLSLDPCWCSVEPAEATAEAEAEQKPSQEDAPETAGNPAESVSSQASQDSDASQAEPEPEPEPAEADAPAEAQKDGDEAEPQEQEQEQEQAQEDNAEDEKQEEGDRVTELAPQDAEEQKPRRSSRIPQQSVGKNSQKGQSAAQPKAQQATSPEKPPAQDSDEREESDDSEPAPNPTRKRGRPRIGSQ